MTFIKDYATEGLRDDRKRLMREVRSLWADGYNTADMARVLNLKEHECERALHFMLAIRRSVIGRKDENTVLGAG